MILYDHKCLKCEHEFEVSYSMSQIGRVKVPCPKCGALSRKIIGGTPHIILGWQAPKHKKYFTRGDFAKQMFDKTPVL